MSAGNQNPRTSGRGVVKTLLEAANQALDALSKLACLGNGGRPGNSMGNTIALEAHDKLYRAIEQTEKQEPVASVGDLTIRRMNQALAKGHQSNTPLYTHSGKPAQQTLRDEEIKQAESPCTWTYDDYECSWNGTCGVCWTFVEGSPKENGVSFCPQCGKPVEVAALEPTDWSAA